MNDIGSMAESLFDRKVPKIPTNNKFTGGTAPMIRFFERFEKGAGLQQGGTIQVATEGESATNNQITIIRVAFVQ
jgi:hypothetical protein